ncbi:MAG: penicillin-binding protein activator LpoB [Treponema sp.]|jgi:uncharacterized protein (TIGR02722 family)|nr:penicillin-binding protein activator LpoB [Treponema sp.]
MKKVIVSAALLAGGLLFSACSSMPKVDRVDASSLIDLSGYWDDSDVRIVCESLINDCLNSPRVAQYIQQYSSQHPGKLPAVLVGRFGNDSSEHIDTSIIAKNMEVAIFNSGRLDFVSGGGVRQEIREERQDQQANASEETASALGYETGANLMLTGVVKSIVDRAGKTTVRSYFVSAELTNIETNGRLWMGENSEIKKVIKQSSYRP